MERYSQKGMLLLGLSWKEAHYLCLWPPIGVVPAMKRRFAWRNEDSFCLKKSAIRTIVPPSFLRAYLLLEARNLRERVVGDWDCPEIVLFLLLKLILLVVTCEHCVSTALNNPQLHLYH